MKSTIFLLDTPQNRIAVFENPHFKGLSYSTITKNGRYAVADIEHNNYFRLYGYFDDCNEIVDSIINDRPENYIKALRTHFFDKQTQNK